MLTWGNNPLLRGTNVLKCMQIVHWKNFIMRGVSLLGEFIIRGFTVVTTNKYDVAHLHNGYLHYYVQNFNA